MLSLTHFLLFCGLQNPLAMPLGLSDGLLIISPFLSVCIYSLFEFKLFWFVLWLFHSGLPRPWLSCCCAVWDAEGQVTPTPWALVSPVWHWGGEELLWRDGWG